MNINVMRIVSPVYLTRQWRINVDPHQVCSISYWTSDNSRLHRLNSNNGKISHILCYSLLPFIKMSSYFRCHFLICRYHWQTYCLRVEWRSLAFQENNLYPQVIHLRVSMNFAGTWNSIPVCLLFLRNSVNKHRLTKGYGSKKVVWG